MGDARDLQGQSKGVGWLEHGGWGTSGVRNLESLKGVVSSCWALNVVVRSVDIFTGSVENLGKFKER